MLCFAAANILAAIPGIVIIAKNTISVIIPVKTEVARSARMKKPIYG
jgi:hypothetical protein